MRRRRKAFVFVLQTGPGHDGQPCGTAEDLHPRSESCVRRRPRDVLAPPGRPLCYWRSHVAAEVTGGGGDDGILTSETLTRPSWKEQSLAFWVHTWRYLHQWQGKEPFTHERQLKHKESRLNGRPGDGSRSRRYPSGSLPFPLQGFVAA